jgi:hypothetical protein
MLKPLSLGSSGSVVKSGIVACNCKDFLVQFVKERGSCIVALGARLCSGKRKFILEMTGTGMTKELSPRLYVRSVGIMKQAVEFLLYQSPV